MIFTVAQSSPAALMIFEVTSQVLPSGTACYLQTCILFLLLNCNIVWILIFSDTARSFPVDFLMNSPFTAVGIALLLAFAAAEINGSAAACKYIILKINNLIIIIKKKIFKIRKKRRIKN